MAASAGGQSTVAPALVLPNGHVESFYFVNGELTNMMAAFAAKYNLSRSSARATARPAWGVGAWRFCAIFCHYLKSSSVSFQVKKKLLLSLATHHSSCTSVPCVRTNTKQQKNWKRPCQRTSIVMVIPACLGETWDCLKALLLDDVRAG